jgi:hypothetical protein
VDAGRIPLPGEVHLVNIVGSAALQERIVGVLFTGRKSSRRRVSRMAVL